ncbi:MAG: sodium-dependent bicarbonate transport family permease [Thermoleophilia bacterium]
MIPAFALGALATVAGSDLRLPAAVTTVLSYHLLFAIGLIAGPTGPPRSTRSSVTSSSAPRCSSCSTSGSRRHGAAATWSASARGIPHREPRDHVPDQPRGRHPLFHAMAAAVGG